MLFEAYLRIPNGSYCLLFNLSENVCSFLEMVVSDDTSSFFILPANLNHHIRTYGNCLPNFRPQTSPSGGPHVPTPAFSCTYQLCCSYEISIGFAIASCGGGPLWNPSMILLYSYVVLFFNSCKLRIWLRSMEPFWWTC